MDVDMLSGKRLVPRPIAGSIVEGGVFGEGGCVAPVRLKVSISKDKILCHAWTVLYPQLSLLLHHTADADLTASSNIGFDALSHGYHRRNYVSIHGDRPRSFLTHIALTKNSQTASEYLVITACRDLVQ
jgi:hypothetical protein